MIPLEDCIRVVDSGTETTSVMKRIANSGSQDDGFYICDLSEIILKYRDWKNSMPRVKSFYAVKCNHDRTVLDTLAALGSGFDCASKGEIIKILSLGVSPDRIIFANTIKKDSHIQYAAENGVTMMTFDSKVELYKIAKIHFKAKLILRIKFDDITTKYTLGEKFGVDSDTETNDLLKLAQFLNMDVIGVSFHIGSKFKDFSILISVITAARKIFDMGLKLGYDFKLLDIGGGFPGSKYTSIEKLGALISDSLEKQFPDQTIKVISEPGRYFANSAFNLISKIHTKKIIRKTIENEVEYIRMYYVGISVYNTLTFRILNDTYKILPLESADYGKNQKKHPSVVWGSTCDPCDQISNCLEQLPEMEEGDWLVMEETGAYTISMACDFNGFPLPKIHSFINKEDWLLLTEEVTHPLPKDRFVHENEQEVFLNGFDDANNNFIAF